VIAVGLQRGGDFTGSYVGLSGAPPLPIVGKDPVLVAIALWTAVLLVVVMYSHFERTRIKELAVWLPHLADRLKALEEKLVDLLPVIQNNVYHPRFAGSFSIKQVLNPLVPDLTYNDLTIVDGLVASVEIARLLFVAHLVKDRDQLRQDLLAYCERDTWAMVRLLARLREMAE